jgi:hypothetical protein
MKIIKFFRLITVRVFPLIILFLLLASSQMKCIQGYQPATDWEKDVFKKSALYIYPDDIRVEFEHFKDKLIAWAGIIQETEFYDNSQNYEVILLIEHRYFDWKLALSDDPDLYYPSIAGEGLFQTNWYLKKNSDLDYFRERFSPGNMAIVYAIPDTIIDDVILVNSKYIRIIDDEYVRADQINYYPY